jgi:hypothetical protein
MTSSLRERLSYWIPAFAGMTDLNQGSERVLRLAEVIVIPGAQRPESS